MPAEREIVRCRYHYDPLDRLASCRPQEQANLRRFYCRNRLATEIQGQEQRTVFQQDDQLLAQQLCQDGTVTTSLMATDQQRSVLQILNDKGSRPSIYTAYGHRSAVSGLTSLLGFNGERADPATGYYLLGNGYRPFNPVLMRFTSPDSWSPFGRGGLNSYAYCLGDPINFRDPNGHTPWGAVIRFFRSAGLMAPKVSKSATSTPILKVTTPVNAQTNKTALSLPGGGIN